MNAKVIAVYSLKGGVGKTTLAVNLAWAASAVSKRQTLLWDLDAQAAATFILRHDGTAAGTAQAAIRKAADPAKRVRATAYDRLSLLPADASLRNLDQVFQELDKKKRLAKLASELGREFDRIVIDCPPGLTDTSEQVLRAADLVVVPVIPSRLSHRALETVEAHFAGMKGIEARIFPVFSMVDRRRLLHREALALRPDWPVVPMASAFETMAERRAPLGAFVRSGLPALASVFDVWKRVEAELARHK